MCVSQADSAENVKAILLSSQTEGLLLKMNWKVRTAGLRQIKKRAAQFDVAVPAEFAAGKRHAAQHPQGEACRVGEGGHPVPPGRHRCACQAALLVSCC